VTRRPAWAARWRVPLPREVRENALFLGALLFVVLKTIFLPGQARDKRREQLRISTLLQEAEAEEGGC